MGEFVDLVDKIKRYYSFTPYELRGFLIATVAISFVISFRQWGPGERFDLAAGLFNFFNAFLIVALAILVRDAGQRIWGLAIGFKIEFKMWTFGVLAALLIAFVSNGNVWFIVPGGFMLHHLAGHRLGYFRYGINYFGQAMIAFAGILSTLTLIILLKILYALSQNPLLSLAIKFNIIYAITSLIPIPPLDGGKIFFGSRMLYAFVLPAMLVALMLMIVDIPIFLALVLSLLVGIILWIVYYVSFERKVWAGPK